MGEIAKMHIHQKEDAVEAWHLLQKVHQIIYKELQRNFYDKGITTAQFEVLLELKKHRELPMWKIGDLLSVTGGNVTGLIDRLEKKGLVARERSEKDRRIIMARITNQGDRLFKNVSGEFEQKLNNTLSGLGNGELNKFNLLLEKLYLELRDQMDPEDESVTV
ncbi:MAG: MarR family transcriptional regulator [Firmicutes bacterium]|nr:MarR family transcriptional regulator [Bacillota bacterium]